MPTITRTETPLTHPIADLVGADEQVPLVTGGSVRYANLDIAASAPALHSGPLPAWVTATGTGSACS